MEDEGERINKHSDEVLEREICGFIENTLNPLKKFNGKTPDDLAELKNLLEISLEKINTEIQILRIKGISIEIKKPDLKLYTEDEYRFDC